MAALVRARVKLIDHILTKAATKKKPPAPRYESATRAVFWKKLLLLFLGGLKGDLCGSSLGSALLELVHATRRIHELLLARVERMAGVANADDDG